MKSNKQSPEEFASQFLEREQKNFWEMAPRVLNSVLGDAVIKLLERGERISHEALLLELQSQAAEKNPGHPILPTLELALQMLDRLPSEKN